MSESETSENAVEKTPTFGQALKAAREQSGASIAEVAAALNLPEDMVTAIERSDLDALPPPAFVQGYMRNYARHLGMDEKAVVDEFERDVPRVHEPMLQPRSPLPAEAHSGTLIMRTVTSVVGIVVVAVILYAVYSYYSEKNNEMEMAMSQQPATGTSPLPVPVPVIRPETRITPVARPLPTVPEPQQQSEATPQTLVEPIEPVETAPLAESADAAAPVEMLSTQSSGDRLRLTAEGDSWAEIADANGNRLFYGLISSDRDLNLTGKAPFEVFLGNAPIVDVVVNGVDIDMTKYIQSNNIARFRVSTVDGQPEFQ